MVCEYYEMIKAEKYFLERKILLKIIQEIDLK